MHSISNRRQKFQRAIRKSHHQEIFSKQRLKLISTNRKLVSNQKIIKAIEQNDIELLSQLLKCISIDTVDVFKEYSSKLYLMAMANFDDTKGANILFLLTLLSYEQSSQYLQQDQIIQKINKNIDRLNQTVEDVTNLQKFYLGILKNIILKTKNDLFLKQFTEKYCKKWFPKYAKMGNFLILVSKVSETQIFCPLQAIIQNFYGVLFQNKGKGKQIIILSYALILINHIIQLNTQQYFAFASQIFRLLIQSSQKIRDHPGISIQCITTVGFIIQQATQQQLVHSDFFRAFKQNALPRLYLILQIQSQIYKKAATGVIKIFIARLSGMQQKEERNNFLHAIVDQKMIFKLSQMLQESDNQISINGLQCFIMLFQCKSDVLDMRLGEYYLKNIVQHLFYHTNPHIAQMAQIVYQSIEQINKEERYLTLDQ